MVQRAAAAIISLLLAAAAGTGVPQASHLSSHLRAVLAPARTAPVRDECSHFLVHDADGNVAPLLCAHGEVNTLAWQAYARGWVGHGPFISSTTMGLGPHATYRQVIAAMCVDMAKVYGTVPLTLSSEVLAAAYYGWHFSQDQNQVGYSKRSCRVTPMRVKPPTPSRPAALRLMWAAWPPPKQLRWGRMGETRFQKFGAMQLRCGIAAFSACLVMGPAPAQAVATAQAPASTPHPHAVAPVADGETLLHLAEIARTVSLAWSEPRPWDVRAAMGSERAANALAGRDGMTYDYGSTARRWVVALDGRFQCRPPSCAISDTPLGNSPPTTTGGGSVPVSTIVIAVDPATLQPDPYLEMVDHSVDMATLGPSGPLPPVPHGS